jgi:hypothetical protein
MLLKGGSLSGLEALQRTESILSTSGGARRRSSTKILKGAKPDLPVEQATKFIMTLNLKTAKAIGVELRSELLTRADKAIECGGRTTKSASRGSHRRPRTLGTEGRQ